MSSTYTNESRRPQNGRRSPNVPKSQVLTDFHDARLINPTMAQMKGHILEFATDYRGSLYIQDKLSECSREEWQWVVDELSSDPSAVMLNVYGTHVAQMILCHEDEQLSQPFFVATLENAETLAGHPQGSHMLLKAIEKSNDQQLAAIALALSDRIVSLGSDKTGNRVVQKLIERANAAVHRLVMEKLMQQHGALETLARDCYGKFVVEKLLLTADEQTRGLLGDLLKDILAGLPANECIDRIYDNLNRNKCDEKREEKLNDQSPEKTGGLY